MQQSLKNLTLGVKSIDNFTNIIHSFDNDDGIHINIKYKLHIIVPILWSLIIFIGVIGNGLVLFIIFKRKLLKNSCTNCYIANLAISDLSFTLIAVPITMTVYVFKQWIFGEFMCHFNNFLIYLTLHVTCLTLTAMTIDRYLAILYPFKSMQFRTSKIAFFISICIWIVSLILCIPFFIYHKTSLNNETTFEQVKLEKPIFINGRYTYAILKETYLIQRYCSPHYPGPNWEKGSTIYTVTVTYVIPLTIIILCYMRIMMKIVKKSNDNIWENQSTSIPFTSFRAKKHQSYFNSKETKEMQLFQINSDFRDNDYVSGLMTLNKKREKKCHEENEEIVPVKIEREKKFLRSTSTLSCATNSTSSKNKSKKNYPISRVKSSYLVIKQRRRKILLLIATVSLTFAVLWLPIHIIHLWQVVFTNSFPYTEFMYIIKLVSHTLSYSNSCFNPFIYVFMGQKFRQYFIMELRSFKTSLTCAKNMSKSNDSITFYQNGQNYKSQKKCKS